MNKEQIIKNYKEAVDPEIINFINDVLSGRDVLPLTVGFIDDKMADKIYKLTGLSVKGNRIVLGPDDVRHIIKRHGQQGKADHSMENIEDIARMSYVLANYDSIEWNGSVSNHYQTTEGNKAPKIVVSKRVNGTYYIIEVVSDSKKSRNIVISAYLQNAGNQL